MDWKQRRAIADRLYQYSDNNVSHIILTNQTDDELTSQVISFFENQSEMIYPAKYIFCNIVYSYFLNKYFKLDFYEQLNDKETLSNSVAYYLYDQYKDVYDAVIDHVLPNIEQYASIAKTRKYFKQEFLITDEDISDIL